MGSSKKVIPLYGAVIVDIKVPNMPGTWTIWLLRLQPWDFLSSVWLKAVQCKYILDEYFRGKIMERALLWMKCAAMHDPVRPVLKRAAAIGWEAKHRQVELVIERAFKGEELLLRMKGWVTEDVAVIANLVKQYGKLRVLDETDLVVETKDKEAMDTLSGKLSEAFGQEVWLEAMAKSRLE